MAFEKKNALKKRRVLFVNWKEINGASVTRRVLRLCSNETGEYICPITGCLHIGFKSQRGLRKHINSFLNVKSENKRQMTHLKS